MTCQAKELAPRVIQVSVPLETPESEAWFLLRSDVHHDNVACDRDLEYKHLKQARERGALVIDNGDLFCAMQGKWDKRADQAQLRPEHRGNNYLDKLVDTTADDYAEYAELFLAIGKGNHETGIMKRHETDLTERLLATIYAKTGHKIHSHGYDGWVFFTCRRRTQRRTFKFYRHHGYGGGRAEVTRGTIHTNRTAVYLPDADIIMLGHTHDEYIVPIARQRVNQRGRQYYDEQHHIRVPGYKKYVEGGWERQRGMSPRPRGAMWLRFYRDQYKERDPQFRFEVLRAQ